MGYAHARHLSNEYPFHRATWWRVRGAVQSMQYLDEAARDIEQLHENLQKLGKLEWARSLIDSVAELKPENQAYIAAVTDGSFQICW